MVKHEAEIRKSFSDLFRESWMDDNDFEEFIQGVVRKTGYTFEMMSNDIDIGIKNGYSVDYQMKLLAKAFNIINTK